MAATVSSINETHRHDAPELLAKRADGVTDLPASIQNTAMHDAAGRNIAVQGTAQQRDVRRRVSLTRTLVHEAELSSVAVDRLWSSADELIESGAILKAGNRCTVALVELDQQSWVLKRYNLRGVFHTAVHLLLPSRARHCWRIGRTLSAAGVATPRPVAFLERGWGPFRTTSYLLTPFVPGASLQEVLDANATASNNVTTPNSETSDLSTALASLSSIWRSLAKLRMTHGDAKCSNFLVSSGGQTWVIDLDSAQRHWWPVGYQQCRARDRQRFLKDWQQFPQLSRLLAECFEAGVHAMPTESCTREPVHTSPVDHDSMPTHHDEIPRSGTTSMWTSPHFRKLLQSSNLDSVDAVSGTTNGYLMRRLPTRENWRLDLADDTGSGQRMYLKKHRERGLYWRLRALFRLGPGKTAGRMEAENILQLWKAGIPNISLVAFGETLNANGELKSFLLTEDLAGFTQLDDYFDQRFPEIDQQRDLELRRLIENAGDVAARFHNAGFNHRDFYCCHFFIREREPGQFDVHLIDLQRVQRRRICRRRWLVKDLAQLAYSASRRCVGPRERLWFMKRYLGVTKLNSKHKRFIRQILAKERWMERRLGPYQ